MSKLKMGKMMDIPYNEIKSSDMNRDLIKHHTNTLSESYKDYGERIVVVTYICAINHSLMILWRNRCNVNLSREWCYM